MADKLTYDISKYQQLGNLTNQDFKADKVLSAIQEIHQQSPLQRLMFHPKGDKAQAAELWNTYKGLMDFYIKNTSPAAKSRMGQEKVAKALMVEKKPAEGEKKPGGE